MRCWLVERSEIDALFNLHAIVSTLVKNEKLRPGVIPSLRDQTRPLFDQQAERLLPSLARNVFNDTRVSTRSLNGEWEPLKRFLRFFERAANNLPYRSSGAMLVDISSLSQHIEILFYGELRVYCSKWIK